MAEPDNNPKDTNTQLCPIVPHHILQLPITKLMGWAESLECCPISHAAGFASVISLAIEGRWKGHYLGLIGHPEKDDLYIMAASNPGDLNKPDFRPYRIQVPTQEYSESLQAAFRAKITRLSNKENLIDFAAVAAQLACEHIATTINTIEATNGGCPTGLPPLKNGVVLESSSLNDLRHAWDSELGNTPGPRGSVQ